METKTPPEPRDALDELHGYYFEDLRTGMSAVYAKTVSETDIVMFAGISGDDNPLHLNHDFARRSIFKGPVAHGSLTASFVSTVIGTRLPGPGCIYVRQSLNFRAPVRAGDTVVARTTIKKLVPEKRFAIMETACTVDGRVVLDGEALVLVPTRPDSG
ncbi:MAG: MaoC family dehydratase [Alphaproteobacteria bacterium]